MRWLKAAGLAALLLSGCQIHQEEPTGGKIVAGMYRDVAECFYLKVRGEGFWSIEHLETVQASEVTMGNIQYRMGTITFREHQPGQTAVVFQIPHPGKFSRMIDECAGG